MKAGNAASQAVRHQTCLAATGDHAIELCRCRVATLKYLPQALPGVSLFGGSSAAKQPIFVSNGFGNSSWGSYDTAMAGGMEGLSMGWDVVRKSLR